MCLADAFSTHCLLEALVETAETTTKGNGSGGQIKGEMDPMTKQVTLLVVGNA